MMDGLPLQRMQAAIWWGIRHELEMHDADVKRWHRIKRGHVRPQLADFYLRIR
jgi:hypothetical protein